MPATRTDTAPVRESRSRTWLWLIAAIVIIGLLYAVFAPDQTTDTAGVADYGVVDNRDGTIRETPDSFPADQVR